MRKLKGRTLRDAKRLLEVLEYYGVSEEDIPLLAAVKAIESRVAAVEGKVDPAAPKGAAEEIVKAFMEAPEEFDPHAK